MDFAQDRKHIAEYIDIGGEILYLGRHECENIGLTRSDILELTEAALVAHGQKDYEMPAKIGVHPYDDVFYHAMPAYVPARAAVGMKWIECYPNNPAKFDLPQTTGLLVLNDVMSGCPIAVMDSTWITAMRTPAVTILAAQKLHPRAKDFGMFGCGVQGREHVRFASEHLSTLERIHVYDVDPAAAGGLIADLSPEVDVELVQANTPRDIVESCELMSSATIITKETLCVVQDEWVRPGQTILPCDLNTFWDPRISRRADRYIVDSLDEHRLFEDMGYFPDGLPAVDCETGEIVAGLRPGRASDDELIVCSNIGMAVCDVVVGRAVFDLALGTDRGIRLTL